MTLVCLLLFAQREGENIRFSLLGLAGEDVPADVAAAVDGKLHQALNRTGALTEAADGIFAVRPTLAIGEEASAEGMMRDLTRVRGDLTLEAFNSIDGTVFYSVTVPVSATATGSKADALKKMATGIKSTDPVYVRFVRNARKKIVEYYADNCAVIVQRAQTLVDTGKGAEATALLESVPADVDCYDTARRLIAEIGGAPQVSPDTVVIENVVEVPVEVPVYVEPEPAPAPAPEPVPAAPKYTIKLSHPDAFSFRFISCTGSRVGEQVKIVGEFVNTNCRYEELAFALDKVFDDNGNEFDRNNLRVRGYNRSNVNAPRNVPVRIEMTVYGVKPAVASFSYLHIDFNYMSIEIYNLPIDWQ